MGTARATELARSWVFQIAAGKGGCCSFGDGKAVVGNGHEEIRPATRDILALAAVTLRLHHRVCDDFITQCAAVTSTLHTMFPLPVFVGP